VPLLGLFTTFYLGIAVYYYLKALKVYRKNQKRVKEPFKTMKFDE